MKTDETDLLEREDSAETSADEDRLAALCERLLPLLDRELGRLAREGRYGA